MGFSVKFKTQNPVSMLRKCEKVAHLKFPSQGGQSTNISLVYLAHGTMEKRSHASGQSLLESVFCLVWCFCLLFLFLYQMWTGVRIYNYISETIIKWLLCSCVFKNSSHVKICNCRQIYRWAENIFIVLAQILSYLACFTQKPLVLVFWSQQIWFNLMHNEDFFKFIMLTY